jgi:hypothetical protein
MALNASNDIADIIANHGQTYARPIGSSCVIKPLRASLLPHDGRNSSRCPSIRGPARLAPTPLTFASSSALEGRSRRWPTGWYRGKMT